MDQTVSQETSLFIELPIELVFAIFNYLSIKDLSYITITSKSLRNLIDYYCVTSKTGYKNLLPCHLRSSLGKLSLSSQSNQAIFLILLTLMSAQFYQLFK